MNRWYRAYEGTVSDPKLGEVAILAETSRSVAVATWHAILESCASAHDGGRFDTNPRRVASILGEPVALIERVFSSLKKVGMTDGRFVASWCRRQFESDSSTERSRSHRQRKRNAPETDKQRDATLRQRDGTSPSVYVYGSVSSSTSPPPSEDGGRVVTGARAETKKPKPAPPGAVADAVSGPLWKFFSAAYRGPVNKAAERKFRALIMAAEDGDAIIAAAHRANPDMPAEQWLDEKAWAQLSLLPAAEPERKPLVSTEALALADEIAAIAGQDVKFLEPGWCGAAWRCQMWLDQKWPRDLIVDGVRSMVAAKSPEKIGNVAYFERGLARFIAQRSRPVPKVIEHEAQTVEVTRGKAPGADDPRSLVGALDRVWDRAEQMQHGGRAHGVETPVHQLPARSVQRSG